MPSTRKKKINYAEVDSDVDLDEEERELDKIKALEQLNSNENKSKKVGDTFGTTRESYRLYPKCSEGSKADLSPSRIQPDSQARGNSKKKRRTNARKVDRQSTATPEPDEPTYDSKLLLDLPFDLFVEVCSHLEGKDLLSLAKVNTVLRNILLSRGARSIWSSLRRKLGFPLPDGLSEIDFALLEYSETCQWEPTGVENNLLVRKFLISDLETVDQVLKELEDDDENAISQLQSVRAKGSSTRPRRSNTNEEVIEANHVENFVREKQEWVKNEQNTSEQIIVNRKRLAQEARNAERERREARRKAIEAQVAYHQWADDEAEYLKRWEMFDQVAPKVAYADDPAAWTDCRTLIRKVLDDEIAEELKEEALEARRSRLESY
ncbi:uncharacterized protein JCM6883_002814 [Sporobolomyces salmoneus]|uniref:uncharacterized protein n=1 Tax=Sporobolomyces salmoneus TaxID=183962 RepID=UPI00316D2F29